ncbi:MAG: hypothetical protein ACI9HK_003001 [Pirellulaceae bacterium]|jgi:hypothetical protein
MAGADGSTVIVPGKPDRSILYEVRTLDPEDDSVMPPEGKGDVMTARQLAYLRIWIEDGADFGGWAGAAKSKSVVAAVAGQVQESKGSEKSEGVSPASVAI